MEQVVHGSMDDRRADRGRAVWMVAVLCALLAGAFVARRAQLRQVPPPGWYEGAAGFAEAMRAQRETAAPLLVYFHTEWCGYCKRFEHDLLPAQAVRSYLDGVVKVRLNPERSPEERAVAADYGVRGYPALFVERGGTRARVFPFMQDAGGWSQVTPERFIAQLQGR